MKNVSIIIFVLIIAISCNKEPLLPPTSGNPEFVFNGNIAGNDVSIEAGVDDFFMFTSFSTDEGVVMFNGNFDKLSDCETNCEESLSISIRDIGETQNPGDINIDESLFVGERLYYNPNEFSGQDTVLTYEVSFDNQSQTASPTFSSSWSISDTIFSFDKNPVDTFLNLDFTARLQITSQTGGGSCTQEFTRPIQQSNPVDPDFYVALAFEEDTNSVDRIVAMPFGGIPPYAYSWENSGQTSSSIFVQIPDLYCVTVTDVGGAITTNCMDVTDVFNILTYCSAAFDYEVTPIEDITINPINPTRFSSIIIDYTDPSGNTFSSMNGPQPNESDFTIVTVEDFEDNENGEKTKKLLVRFNCTLYGENGSEIQLTGAEATFAIAYPQ